MCWSWFCFLSFSLRLSCVFKKKKKFMFIFMLLLFLLLLFWIGTGEPDGEALIRLAKSSQSRVHQRKNRRIRNGAQRSVDCVDCVHSVGHDTSTWSQTLTNYLFQPIYWKNRQGKIIETNQSILASNDPISKNWFNYRKFPSFDFFFLSLSLSIGFCFVLSGISFWFLVLILLLLLLLFVLT